MKHFIGMDVSKATLDICVEADGRQWSEANSSEGFETLQEKLSGYRPALVVLEATGGYERPVAKFLKEKGWEVCVVNPRQVRDFAKATGKLAKTDRLDAKVLARFASVIRPEARSLKSDDLQELADLVTRRRQLTLLLTSETNRLKQQVQSLCLQESFQALSEALQRTIRTIEKEIKQRISARPDWKEKDRLLQSVYGVGPIVSASLIAQLPELGTLSRQTLAALVGIAPFHCDSGTFKGQRRIWGGREPVRTALYLATLTAIRSSKNPILYAHYQQLRAQGKKPKVALVACMRKLLTILNAMVKNNQTWNPASA